MKNIVSIRRASRPALLFIALLTTIVAGIATAHNGDELAEVSVAETQSEYTAAAGTTFYNPRGVTANGTSAQIWIVAGNGFAFCRQRGYRTMSNYTGTCGEDESSYLDHVFSSNQWVFRSSGSKNGCYPLFASITCR